MHRDEMSGNGKLLTRSCASWITESVDELVGVVELFWSSWDVTNMVIHMRTKVLSKSLFGFIYSFDG